MGDIKYESIVDSHDSAAGFELLAHGAPPPSSAAAVSPDQLKGGGGCSRYSV